MTPHADNETVHGLKGRAAAGVRDPKPGPPCLSREDVLSVTTTRPSWKVGAFGTPVSETGPVGEGGGCTV